MTQAGPIKSKAYRIYFESGKTMTIIVSSGESINDVWNIAKKMCFREKVVDIK